MSKEAFVEDFVARNGWSVTQFHQRMAVVPCTCGERDCKGWRPELKHRPKLEELSMLPGE
jgi:hypothetical protein